jgi:hypothetical protein
LTAMRRSSMSSTVAFNLPATAAAAVRTTVR